MLFIRSLEIKSETQIFWYKKCLVINIFKLEKELLLCNKYDLKRFKLIEESFIVIKTQLRIKFSCVCSSIC